MHAQTGTISHIEIYASSLEKSSAFWGWFLEKLGYRPYQEWKEGKSWKLGDTYLVFVQTDKKYLDVHYHRKRTGLNHIAVYVGSTEEMLKIKEALSGKGIRILYPKKSIKPNTLYFEDPDRIKVELVVLEQKRGAAEIATPR